MAGCLSRGRGGGHLMYSVHLIYVSWKCHGTSHTLLLVESASSPPLVNICEQPFASQSLSLLLNPKCRCRCQAVLMMCVLPLLTKAQETALCHCLREGTSMFSAALTKGCFCKSGPLVWIRCDRSGCLETFFIHLLLVLAWVCA